MMFQIGDCVNSSSTTEMHERIETLLDGVQPLLLRGVVQHLFRDLTRLMSHLNVVEDCAEKGDHRSLQKALALLSEIHGEARSLLEYIELRATRATAFYHALYDALDGASFAISHELRRVFEHELALASADTDSKLILGKVRRAHGLLQNCFQQSTIILAQVFDPQIDGPAIFNNLEGKREESLQLSAELRELVRLASRAEKDAKPSSIKTLIERLKRFRDSTMHYLMYRDWETYEQFYEELATAINQEETEQVLHRLASYLETLYSHVRMRSALGASVERSEQPVTFS